MIGLLLFLRFPETVQRRRERLGCFGNGSETLGTDFSENRPQRQPVCRPASLAHPKKAKPDKDLAFLLFAEGTSLRPFRRGLQPKRSFPKQDGVWNVKGSATTGFQDRKWGCFPVSEHL